MYYRGAKKMKYLTFMVFFIFLITGCTTVKKTSENEYEVTVQGGPFDSNGVLKEKATLEAQKVCGIMGFEFLKNWMGDYFSFENEKQYTQNAD